MIDACASDPMVNQSPYVVGLCPHDREVDSYQVCMMMSGCMHVWCYGYALVGMVCMIGVVRWVCGVLLCCL
jgi:hypothetical protein